MTTVHSVLAERASPKCQELTLCPILFSFALHICNFMEASSGEIKGRGERSERRWRGGGERTNRELKRRKMCPSALKTIQTQHKWKMTFLRDRSGGTERGLSSEGAVWDDRWTAGRTGVDGLRVDRKWEERECECTHSCRGWTQTSSSPVEPPNKQDGVIFKSSIAVSHRHKLGSSNTTRNTSGPRGGSSDYWDYLLHHLLPWG